MGETCNGVRTSGHWKGCKCNSKAIYQHEGKSYCANHAAELFRVEIIEKDKCIDELEQENERLRSDKKAMRNCNNCGDKRCVYKNTPHRAQCFAGDLKHWTAPDK